MQPVLISPHTDWRAARCCRTVDACSLAVCMQLNCDVACVGRRASHTTAAHSTTVLSSNVQPQPSCCDARGSLTVRLSSPSTAADMSKTAHTTLSVYTDITARTTLFQPAGGTQLVPLPPSLAHSASQHTVLTSATCCATVLLERRVSWLALPTCSSSLVNPPCIGSLTLPHSSLPAVCRLTTRPIARPLCLSPASRHGCVWLSFHSSR